MTSIKTAAIATFVTALLIAPHNSTAHAVINEQTAVAGTFTFVTLRITHGCGTSPSNEIRVKIPEGVTRVSALYSSDWTIEKKTRKLDTPFEGEGGQLVTETVDEIIWRGGTLPDGYYGEFQIRAMMPNTPGETLWFKTIQNCDEGTIRWIEVPTREGQSPYELKETITVLASNCETVIIERCHLHRLSSWALQTMALLLICAMPIAAFAHAQLLSTSPGANEVLVQPPAEVSLTFSESVTPIAVQIVDVVNQAPVNVGALTTQGNVSNLPIREKLVAGTYIVTFRIVSSDAHVISESFSFSVGAKADISADPDFGGIFSADRDSTSVVTFLTAVARVLFMLALLFVVGCVAFQSFIPIPTAILDQIAAHQFYGALVGLGATATYFLASGALMTGQMPWNAQSIALAWQSSLGPSLGIAGLGFSGILIACRSGTRPLLLIGALLLIASRAMTGHPVSREPGALLQVLMLGHVTTVAYWFAALWILTQALKNLTQQAAASIVVGFARGAVWLVAGLMAVGLGMALVHLSNVASLFTTPYGQLLSAKLLVVAGLLGFAAANKYRLTERATQGDHSAAKRLGRNIHLEWLAMIVVIGASTLLATTPPPTDTNQFDNDQSTISIKVASSSSLYTLDVNEVDSGAQGETTLHLAVADNDGLRISPLEWTVSADVPTAGVVALSLPVVEQSDQEIVVSVDFPNALVIELKVDVLVTDFDLEVFEFELPQ